MEDPLRQQLQAQQLPRLDPRTRLVATITLCIAVGALREPAALGLALGAVLGWALATGQSARRLMLQLAAVTVAISPLLLTLLWSTPGEVRWRIGVLGLTAEGVELALQILFKVNALVIFTTACLGSVDQFRLAHALTCFGVSRKIALLMMLVHRYFHVVLDEYRRLRRALKIRNFQPRLDRHTLWTFGTVVASLVVKSVDRSQRIQAAMKCRGFSGQFPLLFPTRMGPADYAFVGGLILVLAALWLLELGDRVYDWHLW